MTQQIADVEEDTAGPTDGQIKTISVNAARALKLQEILIPDAAAILAQLQAEYKNITEVVLPNALTDAKTEGFDYAEGNQKWRLSLETDVKASIPKALWPQAKQWLMDNKHDDLIKRKIVIKFGRDQIKLALKFMADLKKRKVDLQPEINEEVNAQTLGAFVRELRREAVDNQKDPETAVPPDLFGVYKIRYVKFTEPKAKKVV